MAVILYGAVILILAFLLQVAVWHIRLPARQTKMLLLIFFSMTFIGAMGIFLFHSQMKAMPVAPPRSLGELFQLILLNVSVTIAYMITYSAIEADSPSLIIILKIDNAGKEGLDRSCLSDTFNDDLLISPRLKDLLTDRMAVLEAGHYILTGKGIFMARLFTFYRSVLGLGKGG